MKKLKKAVCKCDEEIQEIRAMNKSEIQEYREKIKMEEQSARLLRVR